ncbi:MAG: transketolase [Bacilli bacterium]|nr:transketolase [Bacilli bacterium]
MRDAFVERLIELAREDESIELLTGDLGFGVLRPFKNEFPDRFHNVGIAEQLLIEMATGMAMAGKKVICYSIGNFPVLRCLEQIRNDAVYSDSNVKIVEIGGGYTYGQLGMSHNATEDMAVLLSIPGITIYTPSDKHEAKLVTELMLKQQGTTMLRLERPDSRTIHDDPVLGYKSGDMIKGLSGKGTAVLSYGGISVIAKEVAREKGFAFYSSPMLKPLNEQTIAAELSGYDRVVVVEEHSKRGGLGSIIESMFAGKVKHPIVLKFGLPDEYAPVIGSQDYMRDYVGLSKDKLLEAIGD